MSEDVASTGAGSRKEKRAKRDAERAAKFKSKGKKEVSVPADVPAEDDDEGEVNAQAVAGQISRPERTSTKRKRIDETQDPPATTTKRAKKHKTDEDRGENNGRKCFTLFIGNLPFSTTDSSLDRHFEKLKPFSLRHRTDPKTKKSKGFAFIEFENYDRLKTCLKLYHHSYFDPENPDAEDPDNDPTLTSRMKKKSKGRRINVMLSAGGGGNTEARKEKIKVKNERLEGQRQRRAEAERKDKEKKEKKKRAQEGQDKPDKAEFNDPSKTISENASDGIHPSRQMLVRR